MAAETAGPLRSLRPVPYDSDVVRRLEAEVQAEYVVRYGGPDETPVDPAQFAPPDGAFVVAYAGDEPVAMGGFRRHDETSAEIKRMFVAGAHRGRGHARSVLAELERMAAAAGYRRMVLETGLRQPEAIGLYVAAGYTPVSGFGHYRDSPLNRCFARPLVVPPAPPQ
ncbi:MAG TPA: GNAT family N-acetyltransferase [Jiangellales bacterium]|nr:GNAT family N-acetyltransferase [Jiangellales bacterium]